MGRNMKPSIVRGPSGVDKIGIEMSVFFCRGQRVRINSINDKNPIKRKIYRFNYTHN